MSTGSRSSVLDRRAAVLGEQHLVALAPQHDRQQLPHRSLVVDDEDARRGARSAAARRCRPSAVVMSVHRQRRAGRRTDDRRAACPAAS